MSIDVVYSIGGVIKNSDVIVTSQFSSILPLWYGSGGHTSHEIDPKLGAPGQLVTYIRLVVPGSTRARAPTKGFVTERAKRAESFVD